MQDNLDMLYLVGNGPSRKDVDINTFSEWWGMNMIYRTHSPDMVFVHDVAPQNEVIKDQYYKTGKTVMAEWNELPIDMWDIMKLGLPGTIIETRHPDDDAFVMQGERDVRGHIDSYMIGYNRDYKDNIVIYKNELLENLFCGQYALGYAVHHGYKNICLVGFDSLQFNIGDNVFSKEDFTTYPIDGKCNPNSDALKIQQSQFVSLMEHINKEYPEVKVFFKNPIEGFDEIVYNNLISRYKVEDRWILGQGLESLI
jgi:hypothetical protein